MNEPLTTAAAAAALGYTAETVLKHRQELGGYRMGRSGPWRFPAERIAFYREHPKFLTQPKAAVQELFRLVQSVNLLSTERERRCEARLAEFAKRLAAVEAAREYARPTIAAAA